MRCSRSRRAALANVLDALVEARRRGLATIRWSATTAAGSPPRASPITSSSRALSTFRGSRRRRRARTTRCASSSRGLVEHRRRRRAAGRASGCASGAPCRGSAFVPTSSGSPTELALDGFVLNDERGVVIELEGEGAGRSSASWRASLAEPPPLAVVERRRWGDPFRFRPPASIASRSWRALVPAEPDALVAPDTAPCQECLAELFDPADRRYRYPFINCTNCGPRFTIVRGVPYDRPLHRWPASRCAHSAIRESQVSARSPVSRTADRMSGVRAAARGSTDARRPAVDRGARDAIAAAARGAARRADRRGQGHRRLPPRVPRRQTSAPSRRCARASTARTSRSR